MIKYQITPSFPDDSCESCDAPAALRLIETCDEPTNAQIIPLCAHHAQIALAPKILDLPSIAHHFNPAQIAYFDDSARCALNDAIDRDDATDPDQIPQTLSDAYDRAESYAYAPITLFDQSFDINMLYAIICLRIDELAIFE